MRPAQVPHSLHELADAVLIVRAVQIYAGEHLLHPPGPPEGGYRLLKELIRQVMLTVEHARGGGQGLAVRAWPHLSEETDGKDVEPWIVVPDVRGFSCEWYDFEEDGWSQEWELGPGTPAGGAGLQFEAAGDEVYFCLF